MRIQFLAAGLVVPALLVFLAAPAEASIAPDALDSAPLVELAENAQDGDITGERDRKCKGKKGRKRGEARTGDADELRDGKKRRRGKRRGKKGRRGKRKGQGDGGSDSE